MIASQAHYEREICLTVETLCHEMVAESVQYFKLAKS